MICRPCELNFRHPWLLVISMAKILFVMARNYTRKYFNAGIYGVIENNVSISINVF